jgi:hypothetical protein
MIAKLLVKVMTWFRRVTSGRVALLAALFVVAFSIVLFNLGPLPAVVEANAEAREEEYMANGSYTRP